MRPVLAADDFGDGYYSSRYELPTPKKPISTTRKPVNPRQGDPTSELPPPVLSPGRLAAPILQPQGMTRQDGPAPTLELDPQESKVGNIVGAGFQAFAQGLAQPAPEMNIDPNLGRGGIVAPQNRGPAMMPQAPVKPLFNPMGSRTMPQTTRFGGFLARGGPVKPNTEYVVGEEGPEVLKIDKSGKGKVTPLTNPPTREDYKKNIVPPGPNQVPPIDPNSIPIGGGQMPTRMTEEAGTLSPEGTYGVNDDIIGIENQLKGASEPTPPKLDPDYYQHKYEGEKKALSARGPKAPHKAMSALSYVFQGMEHFANNMMGKANKPIVPLGDARYAREMENIDRKLQPIYEQQAIAQKQKFDKEKALGEMYESNKKRLLAIQAQNPEFVKSVWADQVIDDKEVAEAQRLGYGQLQSGDYRKFTNTESNGQGYSTPEIGAPNWQRNNLPTDPNRYQTPLTVETDGGVPVATTGKDQLNRENAAKVANINYQGRTDAENRRAVTKDNENTVGFKNQQTKGYADANQDADESVILFNKAGDALKMAQDLEAKAAELKAKETSDPRGQIFSDPAERKALEKQAQEYREKAANWKAESEKKAASGVNKSKSVKDLMAPPAATQATPPKSLKAPKVVGQYAGFVFKSPEDLQSDFPGKTPEEIRKLIEGSGGKFQK